MLVNKKVVVLKNDKNESVAVYNETDYINALLPSIESIMVMNITKVEIQRLNPTINDFQQNRVKVELSLEEFLKNPALYVL